MVPCWASDFRTFEGEARFAARLPSLLVRLVDVPKPKVKAPLKLKPLSAKSKPFFTFDAQAHVPCRTMPQKTLGLLMAQTPQKSGLS